MDRVRKPNVSESTETVYGLDNLGSDFESRYDQAFPPLHVVQNGSRAHPAPYPLVSRPVSSGVK
jgi:hypothetical protein